MENYKFDTDLIPKPPISYNNLDCLITAKLLEPKDTDNSLKNLYNRFIRNSDNSNFSDLDPLRLE